ncbi:hypothetical protein ASF60_19770 [Methylobacterium sp. Leaf113]|uniref:hypothetical protein n=1 Tax=Methylobacterium sp. Leaf113 TaxID=1736259 RepID=UPI0006F64ABE|nr:hypothetical protein [Methylobacterium sp. Leaf113]KQP89362.1 hypothetical protein ASF60_19770 [Methylobacterium sp. Leaf113]
MSQKEDEVARAASVASAMGGLREMAAVHKAQIEAKAREIYANERKGKVIPFEDQTEEQKDRWLKRGEAELDKAWAKLFSDD